MGGDLSDVVSFRTGFVPEERRKKRVVKTEEKTEGETKEEAPSTDKPKTDSRRNDKPRNNDRNRNNNTKP